MAFSLPSAWIEQEENLWSKLPLILLCSKESLLFHSCVLYRENTVKSRIKCQQKQGAGGLKAKKVLQREACTTGSHPFRASKELCREAALRPVVGMPKENMLSPFFWDHTAFSTHCHCQRDSNNLFSERGLAKSRCQATFNPIFTLKQMLSCLQNCLVGRSRGQENKQNNTWIYSCFPKIPLNCSILVVAEQLAKL